MPGWHGGLPASVYPGQAPSAIDSSPTIAFLDGPGKPPSVIVGVGSQSVPDQNGGLIAWNANGRVRFRFHTKATFRQWRDQPRNLDNSVFATPAVGDVQGNGQQDIVFGSYDHYIYALNPYGKLLPGFPIDRADTIWSSPALVDYAHNGRDDIIMGGDASGLAGLDGKPCFGGWLTDYRYSPRTRSPHLIWQVCVGQTVWSSPAIGVINSTHRLAVVVGTSFNPAYRESRATDELFAYYLANRAPVPGWPVKTVGPSFGSPAIASLTPGGAPVVISTSCAACSGGPGVVEAWNGAGRRIWQEAVTPGVPLFSSPAVANVTGTGAQDVLVGASSGLYVLNGESGHQALPDALQPSCGLENVPAVFQVQKTLGGLSGWELALSCQQAGRAWLVAYELPRAPDEAPSWPEWRQNSDHTGYAGGSS